MLHSFPALPCPDSALRYEHLIDNTGWDATDAIRGG